MGIDVGKKEITVEIQYSELSFHKNPVTEGIDIVIPYQTGFFDDDGSWVVISSDVFTVAGDAAEIIANLSPSDLESTEKDPIGALLDKLAYELIAGKIETTAKILISEIKSSDASIAPDPQHARVRIIKKKEVLLDIHVKIGEESEVLPAMLDVKLKISAPKFNLTTIEVPVLQGVYKIDSLTLDPKPPEQENEDIPPADNDNDDEGGNNQASNAAAETPDPTPSDTKTTTKK